MKIIIAISLIGLLGCTDLEENIFSSIQNEDYYDNEQQVLSTAGPAYVNLRAYTSPEGLWGANSLTTDEIVLPTRGIHWYNGGTFQRLHRHEWTTSEVSFSGSWNFIFSSVNNCNRTILQLENLETQSEAVVNILNELKGLRTFYFFLGVDLFGNIPIVDQFDVPEGFAPKNESRKTAFEYTVNELVSTLPLLSAANTNTYGRFHKMAGYATLAKLYLNAKVYSGEAMWEKAIAMCDTIINSGQYQLEDDYFNNFAINNEGSRENIFVIPYTDDIPTDWGGGGVPSRSFQLQYWSLHFNGHKRFGMENGAWNGFCSVPAFYTSYDESDIRRQVWLEGLQVTPSGETLYCNQERAGEPLIYTVEVSSLEQAFENEGVRLGKYDYTGAKNNALENDFAIIRYADILLMKAEALMRLNGDNATAEAVELVNQVRSRAFEDDSDKLYTTSTLDMDALLAERGWELAGEAWRRNDLIRFEKYTGTWGFKNTPSTQNHILFPIPQDQITANPNLDQNDGY